MLAEVSFNDEGAMGLLEELRKNAMEHAANASLSRCLGKQDAAAASAALPPSGLAAEVDKGANRAAEEIAAAQRRVDGPIKRTVGFHRVYAAPPIAPPAL